MDSCTHTSPLIDIQPKKTRISMFKRTRISRISESLRGVIFAYRIRIARIPSGWHSCYSPLIKKYSSSMEIRVIREIRVL